MKGITADGEWFIDWQRRETDCPVILQLGWHFGSRNRVLVNGENVSYLPIRRLRTGPGGYVTFLKMVNGKTMFAPDGEPMEATISGNVEYYLLEYDDPQIDKRRKLGGLEIMAGQPLTGGPD